MQLLLFGLSGCQVETEPSWPGALVVEPASPYADSVLRVAGREDCTWTSPTVTLVGCTVLGEDLGLVPGDVVEVSAGDDVGEVRVRDWPKMAVSESTNNSVSWLDAETSSLASRVDLPVVGFSMPVGIAGSGERVWVTTHVDGKVFAIDGDEVSAQVEASGHLYWLVHDSPRQRLLTAVQSDPALLPLSEDVELGDPIALPEPPVSIRLDGDVAWVAARSGGSPTGEEPDSGVVREGWLVRVDLSTGTTEELRLGEGLYWAEPGEGVVAVADQDAEVVYLVDEDLELVDTIEVPGGPTGLAWDGADLYAALYAEGTVVRIDTTSGTVTETWDAGRGAAQVLLRDDGRFLYVPALHKDQILVLDVGGGTEARTIDGVLGPRAIALF